MALTSQATSKTLSLFFSDLFYQCLANLLVKRCSMLMSLLYLFRRICMKYSTDFIKGQCSFCSSASGNFTCELFSLPSFDQILSYLKIKFNYEVIIFLQNCYLWKKFKLGRNLFSSFCMIAQYDRFHVYRKSETLSNSVSKIC